MNTDEEIVPLTKDHEMTWRSYLRSHALLKRILDAELRERHDMTLLTYDALVQLSEAPDQSMHMRDLASALLYSASGLTRIVDGLERAGYATRRTDPGNRRAVLVTLTTTGEQALKDAWPTHLDGVSRYFARHFDIEDARVMQRILSAVTQEIENTSLSRTANA